MLQFFVFVFVFVGVIQPMKLVVNFCLLAFIHAMLLPLTAQMAFSATAVDYDKQIITIALSQEPPQLNTTKTTDAVSFTIIGHLMEGLVRLDRHGEIVPGVATHWDLDDTGATFYLRDNALWSDGIPVRAQDFVFAWRKVLMPTTASEYAFILYSVKNGAAINRGELDPEQLKATAIDDFTLKVEFERPTSYFLKLAAFATLFPIREAFYNNLGERFAADAEDMLFNGPFILTDWVHSASLKMVKNQHYWDKDNITLGGINIDYITEDSRARFNLYTDGKIANVGLDGETYKDALTKKFRIHSFATSAVFFLEYNHTDGHPTRNANLRRAIQHIFDTDEFVNKVLATPGNLPGLSIFPVWLQGVKSKFRKEYPAPYVDIDIAKAKAYLALALTELGLEELPPLVLLVGNTPTSAKQAEYLQGLFKVKLGIELKIDVQTFKQRLAKMTAGDFDIVAAGWGADYDDVMTFGDLFASWNLNNRGRYKNPEYDRFVSIAENSTDPRVRMDAMGELQRILFDDAVVLPQYEQGMIYLMHPKLKGVVRRKIGLNPDYSRAYIIQ